MALKKNITFHDVVEIFLRRKWLILFSFLIMMFGASIYCVVAKEMYTSSSSILVIPQEIPSSYVKSTATYDLGNRLGALQNQIMSKTYLMAVIDKLNLFPEKRNRASEEEMVKAMRSHMGMSVSKQANVFAIYYSHNDPYTAMQVTSTLTSMFIDAHVKLKEQRASGTTEFFETELERAKEQLDAKDEHIKKFRIKYFGELPEQLDANIKALTRMEERLKAINESKRDIEEKISLIDRELATERGKAEKYNVDLNTVEEIVKGADLTLSENAKLLLKQIAEKKKDLSGLRLEYTESHPIIKQNKLVIKKLRDKLRNEQLLDESSRKAYEKYYGISPEAKGVIDMMTVLNGRKKALEKEIRTLITEKRDTIDLIADYRRRIENTPRTELEVKELTRDYDTLKEYYEKLLEKKMYAELSENLEIKQKGEQFQLLDPASLPTKPETPDRPKILLYGLFLSFLVGFGGAVGLEFVDDTVKSPGEFREFFDIPILVTLPLLLTKQQKKKVMLKKMLIMGGLMLYIIAVSAFILSYKQKIISLLALGKLGL